MVDEGPTEIKTVGTPEPEPLDVLRSVIEKVESNGGNWTGEDVPMVLDAVRSLVYGLHGDAVHMSEDTRSRVSWLSFDLFGCATRSWDEILNKLVETAYGNFVVVGTPDELIRAVFDLAEDMTRFDLIDEIRREIGERTIKMFLNQQGTTFICPVMPLEVRWLVGDQETERFTGTAAVKSLQ